jgi:hypothetical protein
VTRGYVALGIRRISMNKLEQFFAVALLIACSTVFADPAPAVAYLLKTPPTMMDLGILRLNMLLSTAIAQTSDFAIHGLQPTSNVSYSGKENRILLFLAYDDKSPQQTERYRDDIEKECRRVVESLRHFIVMQGMQTPFRHVGYDALDFKSGKSFNAEYGEPPEVDQEVQNIMAIHVSYFFEEAKSQGRSMMCEGRMSGTAISVTR